MSSKSSLQPASRKRRWFASFVCWWTGNHKFIELERGYVEGDPPRQVFKLNKLVCRSCGYET